jgi:glycine amidinotransferase
VRANGITRCGKDLYFGINHDKILKVGLKKLAKKYFTNYRCHFVATHGHLDGCFKPVVPGLIISITDPDDNVPYKTEFPGWEVVYLPDESWTKTADWSKLKEKNGGKWWIQGYENDDEVIEFVETWLRDWVGYVEESVFDVNMLMIDKKNVICNGYNKIAFQAFERYGITPHICNLRHRYFWDGGIHCSTLDLHREGVKEDYFPERGTSSIIS